MKIFKKAGYWNVQSEQLKEKFSQLADKEVQPIDGDEEKPIKNIKPTPNAKGLEELITEII